LPLRPKQCTFSDNRNTASRSNGLAPRPDSLPFENPETMTARDEHWNTIFAGKADPELGWYEHDVSQTLKFLDLIPRDESATIFLPGAGTSVLVDELLARGHRLILNDISDEALNRLRERTGDPEGAIWLHHDISRPLPEGLPPADVWIDRAVLHFLLKEGEIRGYFGNLHSALRPGGHALMAEFSTAGARRCAGLDLHRYSIDELTERMGPGFDLITEEDYTYINPAGDPRPYLYALYRKTGGHGV
jgi:EEF1A lysine methyltransferase 2